MKRQRTLHNPDPDRFKDPTRYQYGMLRELADSFKHNPIAAIRGTQYNQTTFRSCLYWGWVELVDNPRKRQFGWRITQRGLDAIRLHENADYHRQRDTHAYSATIAGLHAALAGKLEDHKAAPHRTVKSPISIASRRRVA